MKRYRVWQANREVFLWPENWLYPELRDDQSPFFQQMMSSLLQGDITDDAAASAYLELPHQPGGGRQARAVRPVLRAGHRRHRRDLLRGGADGGSAPQVLLPRADRRQLDAVDPGADRLRGHADHARSSGTDGCSCSGSRSSSRPAPGPSRSPAPPTTPDLASMQVGDLNTFTGKADDGANKNSVQAGAVLCWSEYYNGTWQPTKTSDVNLPTQIGVFDLDGERLDRSLADPAADRARPGHRDSKVRPAPGGRQV